MITGAPPSQTIASSNLNSLVLRSLVLLLESSEGVSEHLPGDGFSTPTQAHNHHRVARVLGLVQLNDLGHCNFDILEVGSLQLLLNGRFHLRIV